MPVKPANNVEIQDEGTSQGFVRTVDFVGAGVSANVAGSKATVSISGGGGGGATWTVIEVDMGSVSKWQGKFDISDAGISGGSKIIIQQAPGPYTGKGTLQDEAYMDPIHVFAYPTGTGTARAFWQTAPLWRSPRLVQGTWALTATDSILVIEANHNKRQGRVRGNIKFMYTVA